MEESNIMGTIKEGWGVASKLAGSGLGSVSNLFASREDGGSGVLSGLYWQRGPWLSELGLVPQLEFFEPHSQASFSASMLRRLTVSKAERSFMQACSNLVSSKQEEAEQELQGVIQRDAQFTDAYFVLGCMQLELERPSEAVASFQKALLCQQGLGVKLKKYMASFRMALPLTPFSSFAFYPDLLGLSCLLSLSLRQAGNYTAALANLEQLLSVMPTEPTALFLVACLRLEIGAYSAIVDVLKDVLPGSTLSVANLLLLGKACQMLGDSNTASELYRNAASRQDIDTITLLDVRYAAAELAGGNGLEQVRRECPEYVPLFERLGFKPGSVSAGVSSTPPAQQLPAMVPPAAAPVAPVAQVPLAQVPLAQVPLAQVPLAQVPPAQVSPAVSMKTQRDLTVYPPLPAVSMAPAAPESNPVMAPAPAPVAAPIAAATAGTPAAGSESFSLQELSSGKLYPLNRSGNSIIGRDSGAIILDNDSAVSHQHAMIAYVGNAFVLTDLHSTNGTWVNGYRVSDRPLEIHRGDRIQVGKTIFVIV